MQKNNFTFYLICGSLILNRHIKFTYTHVCVMKLKEKKCLIGQKKSTGGLSCIFLLDGSQLKTQRLFN